MKIDLFDETTWPEYMLPPKGEWLAVTPTIKVYPAIHDLNEGEIFLTDKDFYGIRVVPQQIPGAGFVNFISVTTLIDAILVDVILANGDESPETVMEWVKMAYPDFSLEQLIKFECLKGSYAETQSKKILSLLTVKRKLFTELPPGYRLLVQHLYSTSGFNAIMTKL